jgi:hypothetical protein
MSRGIFILHSPVTNFSLSFASGSLTGGSVATATTGAGACFGLDAAAVVAGMYVLVEERGGVAASSFVQSWPMMFADI